MKKIIIVAILVISFVSISVLTSCSQSEKSASSMQIAEVIKDDLIIGVIADGNLDMSHEVRLRFGTYGTVQEIYVKKGDMVKEGTLLARLDNSSQRKAIAKALNDVQLAYNQINTITCCRVMGYPRNYPNTTALIRFEQAQNQMETARALIQTSSYRDAMTNIRLSLYDLDNSLEILETPPPFMEGRWPSVNQISDDPDAIMQTYPYAARAISLLKSDMSDIEKIQSLLEQGNYNAAVNAITDILDAMQVTHVAVKGVVGQVAMYGLSTPDVPTTLEYMKPVSETLSKLQEMINSGTADPTELSEMLIMAQHDLDMSGITLENELMYFENGVNLQAMAQYNLNLKSAKIALQNAKDELKKTEILAPFDGEIVDVNVKEYDQLSVYDYASITAVHLVDTSEIQLKGVVDEIDIFHVKVGQEAVVTVDSLPAEEFTGKVTFIAPVASKGTAVVEFPVDITLDKTDIELKGGLTATANLVVEKHENVLVIPIKALKGSSGHYRVDVLIDAKTGKYESKSVTTGIQNDRYIEILSGLNEGEQVIIGTPPSVK